MNHSIKNLWIVALASIPWTFVPVNVESAEISSEVRDLYGDNSRIEILTDPERVEVAVLKVHKGLFRKHPDKYKYSEGSRRPLTQSEITHLSKLLSMDTSYGWNYAKGCVPNYNFRAIFIRGGHSLSLDFCFGCNILLISFDGKPYSGEDFDPIRAEILALLRRYFPDDPVMKEVDRIDQERERGREAIRKAKERDAKESKEKPDSPVLSPGSSLSGDDKD